MQHLKFDVTPLEELSYYSQKFNIRCLCKRDDLFNKAGGGSKARMLQYILYPLYNEKVDVFLTAGGPCSNYIVRQLYCVPKWEYKCVWFHIQIIFLTMKIR